MTIHKFDAEIGKVLKIVINSIYTHKEIFLRELISNSSDAITKLKYELLQNSKLVKEEYTPKITVELNKQNRTVIITDNGIGMTKEDMIQNLGTIAKSGTENFSKMLEGGEKASDLIGQFGVGFYSAFMVAQKVEVISKKAGGKAGHKWSSTGNGEFEITDCEMAHFGTQITLHIKEGEEFEEYLDKFRVEYIIKSYSSHIQTPITLIHETGSEIMENQSAAIWLKSPQSVTDEEYKTAYNTIGGMPSGYFTKIHTKVEGSLEYCALLFIPQTKPYDIYNPARKTSIKLYVKRIFITEENTHILPEHFRFVKGVIDSADLPLNISRETLQNNATLSKIGKALEKKIINEFENKLKNDRENYIKFWNDFGNVIKEGLCKAGDLNEKLLDICVFKSNKNEFTTIEEYISRMDANQDSVYYITAESYEDGINNPQLEMCKKNGIEVLVLTDSVDNFWVNVITNYKEKHFKPVSQANLTIETKTEENKIIDEEKNKELVEYFEKTLGESVASVQISKKLVESPVCLSQNESGMSIRMERYLYEQKQLPFLSPKILEINPDNKILEEIYATIKSGGDASQKVHTLFDIACIEAGDIIKKPSDLAKRIISLLEQ